jgi:hypothetical protein
MFQWLTSRLVALPPPTDIQGGAPRDGGAAVPAAAAAAPEQAVRSRMQVAAVCACVHVCDNVLQKPSFLDVALERAQNL